LSRPASVRWQVGTGDTFYRTGAPGPSVALFQGRRYGWDVRLGLTWEAFTLDLRSCDTNFTKAEGNVFTDQTARFSPANVTAQIVGGSAPTGVGRPLSPNYRLPTINAPK
jgi:hypothetical protein